MKETSNEESGKDVAFLKKISRIFFEISSLVRPLPIHQSEEARQTMFSTTARRNGRDVIRTVVYLVALALVIIFLSLSFKYLQSAEARSLGTIPQVGPAATASVGQEQAQTQGQSQALTLTQTLTQVASSSVAVNESSETGAAEASTPAVAEEQSTQAAPLFPPLLGPGGHIYIPSIGVDLPLNAMANVNDQAPLDRGPSWMQQTGQAGRAGNCVIAGHRSTYTQPFHDLDQLAAGDVVVITDSGGASYTYQVDRVFPVSPSQVEVMSATPDATFTLITCHPLGSSRQRLIVQGHLVK